MAQQQTPVIQNKKLLIVALALALVSVILVNVMVTRARQGSEGEKVKLVGYKKSLKTGERIKESDLMPVEIIAKYRVYYPHAEPWSRWTSIEGRHVLRPVSANELASKMHLREYTLGQGLRRVKPDPGTVSFTFPLDRREIPGDILEPNSRIDLMGRFMVKDRRSRDVLKTLVVIKNVRVLTVGGRGEGRAMAGGSVSARPVAAQRSYDKVTIQVPETVAIKLDHILSHVLGQRFKVAVLSEGTGESDYEITQEVMKFAETAKASGGR